ncbi:MAG: PspC domain-containing protein [Nanobdellota archaeon]
MFEAFAFGTSFVMLSVLLFVAVTFIVWIWALVDIVVSRLDAAEKLIWILIVVYFHMLGAIVYFVVVRALDKRLVHSTKKLERTNKVLGGVAGGIGAYLDMDPTVIRLLWIVLTVFGGVIPGVLAYLIAWAIIPEKR